MSLTFEFFPESYLALNKEIPYHPTLVALLQNQPANEFEIRLAQIAAYCDIVLNGDYTREDFDKLAGILVRRLEQKRPGRIGLTIVQDLGPDLIH